MKHWLLLQAVTFQVIWLASVLGGNQWLPVSLAALCVHFSFSPCRKQDTYILPLACLGLALDTLLTLLGVFAFSQLPVWLLVLWLGFVLNFGHSLKVLKKLSSIWLAIIGAMGGCYAYLASWKLGAVDIPLGTPTTAVVLLMSWAILFPILVKADIYIRRRST